MTSTLHFSVSGIPQGKGAARHTRSGFTYTPTKTRDYMTLVREAAKNAGAVKKDCPCSLKISAYFPIPESYTKTLKASIRKGEVYYTKKPDTDNISKIKDALKEVAFSDDAIVWKEEVTKYYSDTPRLEIEITYYELSSNPNTDPLGYRL